MTSFYLSRPGFAANSLKAILQNGDLVSVRLVPVDSTIAYGPELLPLLADDIKDGILTDCLRCQRDQDSEAAGDAYLAWAAARANAADESAY
jgi:hypothetical protein